MSPGRDRDGVRQAGERVARVVRGVCAACVRDAAAAGIVVLDDWSPEGELLYEWLVRELDEERVWRAASLAANLQTLGAAEAQLLAAWRLARERGALIAHPTNRTALLLGGRTPWADLLPLGDVWASQVEQLAGRWSGPLEVESLADAAGGAAALDGVLERLIDGRDDSAADSLPPAVAERLLVLYERGRHFRLRPRLVPKLAQRTLGVDLFD